MHFILILMLVSPIVLCVVLAGLNRRPGTHPHRNPFTAGFYANLILPPLYLLFHIRTFGSDAFQLVCGLALFLIYLNCCVFLNWFVFTLTDVSMHIQLLMQIERQGTLTPESLVTRYNKNAILGNRIPRLLELGQLREENGRLFLHGKSVLLGAAVARIARRILGIPLHPEHAEHDATL